MLYANYLRNKMHHLVKAVFASGYPLKITSKFNRAAIDYTIHGKTEIGKNLIPFPYAFFGNNSTKTINGITFTSNADGTITLNGTSTASSYFTIILATNIINNIDKTKTYTISMENGIISKIDINLALYKSGKWVENVCTFSKPTVNFATYTKEFDSAVIILIVKANASFDNLIIKPMLEEGSTATEYETYTEYGVGDAVVGHDPYNYKIPLVNNTTITDIYIISQIKGGESISYRADNLPELQLYKGDNTITTNTEIKPTTIDIKYYN